MFGLFFFFLKIERRDDEGVSTKHQEKNSQFFIFFPESKKASD